MKNYFCPKAAVEAGKKNSWEFKMLTLNSLKLKSRTLTFKKLFAKLTFSPALFEKKQSFVCLVFKIENK